MKKSMFLLMLSISLLSCGGASADVLKFATEATYPPFVYMTENGQIAGFDADIVNALCEKMKQKCILENSPWESLIPSLQIGKFDALFGGLGINAQREKVVNFTKPYYQNETTFVTTPSDKFSVEKISGKIIGVQKGSTFQSYLQHVYGSEIQIKSYESNMNALMDLQQGRLDAVFIDKPVAIDWMKKNNDMEKYILTGSIPNQQYFGDGNGIALNKGNGKLLSGLNKALIEIRKDGTYKQIVSKWFG